MKTFITDGLKSAQIRDSWDFVDMFAAGNQTEKELYAKVSAAFLAVNKSARAVANMPFALVTKGGEDYDTSDAWENKVGYIKNPKDLFRRLRQSLIMTNQAYCRLGKDVLGQPKGLHYVMPTSIEIKTSNDGELIGFARKVNGRVVETFRPDDPNLVRFWWLDDNTELLPSKDTEFKAMMNACGIIYYSDYFTENFYRRGGIKPTLIAMKGLVDNGKKDEAEKGWSDFLRGVGQRFGNRIARIFNAEAMDIKPFGDGLGDLKETPVYRQANENIAIALDMPLSLLLSNSANYATAQIEYYQWFRNSVVPWCEFIADTFNEQLFSKQGLRLEFRPEVSDPEKQDEVSHSQAFLSFGDSFTKYPTYDLWISSAVGVYGFEIPDDLMTAAASYYKDKDAKEAELQKQMQQQPQEVKPVEKEPKDDEEEPPAKVPAKWIPSIDELEEMRVWREVATRRWKKGESLDFDYQPHYGGLPESVTADIRARLAENREWDVDRIKTAFTVASVVAREPKQNGEIKMLADALNNLAIAQKAVPPAPPVTNIHMSPISLTAQMPEQGTVTVNVPEQPAPVVNVAPADVTVNVPPAAVTVNVPETNITNKIMMPEPPKSLELQRDKDGKLTGAKVKK